MVKPPDPLVNVPKLIKSPLTVIKFAPGVNMASELMVNDTQVTGALSVA